MKATHSFRVWRLRGRSVILMSGQYECWRVRFIESGRLMHTALCDPREVAPTPFTIRVPK